MTIRYLLDTNILSDLIRNTSGKVADKIVEVGEENVCTSVIVAAELRYGAAKKGSTRLAVQIDAALKSIDVLPFDVPADTEYGVVRAHLQKSGEPISGNDFLIAAHALAEGCVVVTDNEREFRRVPGLTVENWLR